MKTRTEELQESLDLVCSDIRELTIQLESKMCMRSELATKIAAQVSHLKVGDVVRDIKMNRVFKVSSVVGKVDFSVDSKIDVQVNALKRKVDGTFGKTQHRLRADGFWDKSPMSFEERYVKVEG